MALSWLLVGLQIALASILVVASVGKALRTDEFAAALRLTRLPEPSIRPVGIAVAAVELALAIGLVVSTPRSLPATFAAVAGLFAVFTAWMVWIRASRLRIRCGCFGTGSAEVGAATIGRNLVLVAGAVGGWSLASAVPSLFPEPSLPMIVTASAAALALALLSALRAAWPELALTFDRLQAREAPGA